MTLNYRTVTGTYLNPDGTPKSGRIEFTPTHQLVERPGALIPPKTTTVDLDATGSFSVPLLTNDNATIDPDGWKWVVDEKLENCSPWYLDVPTGVGSLDISYNFIPNTASAPVVGVIGPTGPQGPVGPVGPQATGPYVLQSGDTMTGRLTIRGSTPDQLFWNNAGTLAAILGIENNATISIWDGGKSGYGTVRSAYVELMSPPSAPSHAVKLDSITPKISNTSPSSPTPGTIWIKGKDNRARSDFKSSTALWRLNFGFGYATCTATPIAAGMSIANPSTTAGGVARAEYNGTGWVAGDTIRIEYDIQDIIGNMRLTRAFEFSGAVNTGTGAQTLTLTAPMTSQEFGLEVMPSSSCTVTGVRVFNLTRDEVETYVWSSAVSPDVAGWVLLNNPVSKTPGRNRIINGDFSINQRAFTSLTNLNQYGFDRWIISPSGGTVTYSTQTPAPGDLPESAKAFARIATSQTGTNYCYFYQPIESVRTLSGKKATISFWAKAASGTPKVWIELIQIFGTGGSTLNTVMGSNITLSTIWTRYSVTLDIPSLTGKTIGSETDQQLQFRLFVSDGSVASYRGLGVQSNTFDFWGVQLEEGSYATTYEQKSYADELRDCQRYFQRWTQPPLRGATTPPGSCGRMGMNIPTPMRIGPAPSLGAAGLSVWDGTTTGTINAITTNYCTTTAVEFDCTMTSNVFVASGAAVVYQVPGASTSYLDLSAEL